MLTDEEFDSLMKIRARACPAPQMSGVSALVLPRLSARKIIALPALSRAAWYTGVAAAAMLFIAAGVDRYEKQDLTVSDPTAAVYADFEDSLELSWNNR